MRYEALQALGNVVVPVDTEPCGPTPLLLKEKLFFRAGFPVDKFEVNKRLLGSFQANTGVDLLWVDKGIVIAKETLIAIKRLNPGTLSLHYNPDDPFGGYGKSGWRRFITTIPVYDVHFVPRMVNVPEYKKCGAKRVEFLVPTRGFSMELHRPIVPSAMDIRKYGADVGFIGSYERSRAMSLLSLARAGFNVRVWSRNWNASFLHDNIRLVKTPLYGEEYVRALNCFKIALCFLRKNNRDEHSSRSIEIPACGTFMLAERTAEHIRLFKEGVEAEYFGDDSELIAKCGFYLSNDHIRSQIAKAGRNRCEVSGYDYRNRVAAILRSAFPSRSFNLS